MRRTTLLITAVVCLLGGVAAAQDADSTRPGAGDANLLNYCRGFKEELAEAHGTRVGVLINYQGQLLLNGERREGKGKSAFSYDLEVVQGLWRGGRLVACAQGGAGEGLDEQLGTVLGINDDAGEPRCLFLSNLYFTQELLDGRLQLAGGKLCLTDFFDTNEVANCENSQFLSSSLVNNPTIPFPDDGIAAVVRLEPVDGFYLQAGVADAQAVGTQTGLNTAFHEEDYSFSALELGVSPRLFGRPGNYRFLLWYDPQPLAPFDGSDAVRDDAGFALSFDQAVSERVTLFCRCGFAHEEVREVEHFWSAGAELAAPLAGRAEDVAGAAVSQAIVSDEYRKVSGAAASETLFELYYALRLNEYVTLTPDLQVVLNPGADDEADTAVVAGIRAVFEL